MEVEEEPKVIEEKDDLEDEYSVEAIRNKRKNPKTGAIEYYIKWENYPENQNTWEPIDHLSCPEKILEYEEKEKQKKLERKRRCIKKEIKETPGVINRFKRRVRGSGSLDGEGNANALLVEDDNTSSTETVSSYTSETSKKNKGPIAEEVIPQVKGFERNLPLEKIIGSCTDEKDKLWFLIKWRGLCELDLVEVNDLETNAPKELCLWYKERLYHTIKLPNEDSDRPQQEELI